MQTLNSGDAQSTNGTADVCEVQNKVKATKFRKILPMTKIEPAQGDKSRLVVAEVLSTMMIPQSVSHTNERFFVSNGVSNGTFRLISTKSPDSKFHTSSSTVLQTLKSSTSISSGNVRVISKRSVAINDSQADRVFKSPTSISKEMLTKRMKITTVAKRVPLINTVGNQSKLTPLVPSETSSKSNSETVAKPFSILEAVLTSPSTSSPSSAAKIPAKTGRDKEVASSDALSSRTSFDDPDSNLEEHLRSIKGDCGSNKKEQPAFNDSEDLWKPSLKLYNLSYEKGVTRLVAVKPRTVTMVDVSTQVFMPQSAEQCSDTKNMLQTSSLHAEPMEISGCLQPAAMKSFIPSTQNQFVVVDTKNGKKVVAIPKEILNSYAGPKTFIIEGKSLKRKSDFTDESIPKRSKSPRKDPSVSVSHPSTSSVVNLGNQNSLNVDVLSQLNTISSNCLTGTSPSLFETRTTSSNKSDSVQQSQASYRISDNAVMCVSPSSNPCLNDFVGSELDCSDSIILSSNVLNETDLSSLREKLVSSTSSLSCDSSLKSPSVGPLSSQTASARARAILKGLASVVSGNNQGPQAQEHSGSLLDSPDASNVKGSRQEASKQEVDKFVKNAFTDFKNCLVFNQGNLPIHDAVENDDSMAVKRQCIVLKSRRISVDILNSNEETSLQVALYYSHSTLVPLLLQHGADATVLDREGNSTLHLAVTHAEESLKDLLSSGQFSKSSINCLNDEGFSALHLAAQSNKISSIRLLVRHGADVDQPDGKSGRTALFHAVERKCQDAQNLLVSLGADSREASYAGFTPNHVTRADAMAQFSTSMQAEIIEQIKLGPLLKLPSRSKSHVEVK